MAETIARCTRWRVAHLPLAVCLLALAGALAAPTAFAQSATERLLEIKRQQEQGQQPGASGQAGGRQAGAQPGAQGGAVSIEAEGLASYYEDDAARSRNEAIEAAQRDAVEQASGVFITSETEMRNFDLVSDEVLSRSQGFIRDYEVLEEGRDGPFYNVRIRAEVVKQAFIEDIEKSLEALYGRVGKPRIMLVVQEFESGNGTAAESTGEGEGEAAQAQAPPASALNVVEKEIRKILLRQGVTFVDARTVTEGSLVNQAAGGLGASRAALLDSARTSRAELVMIGHGRVSPQGQLQQFNIVEASVGLDVIRTSNGQVMASDVATGKGLHINPDTATVVALQKAAQEITPRIMEQVTYLWIKEKNEGQRIEMVVRNVASYGDVLALRRALANTVKGVASVRQKSFGDGVALLEVESRDAPDRLAESLFTTEFGDFRLEIEDVSSTTLTVNMVKP